MSAYGHRERVALAFGSALRAARQAKGITHEHLAELSDLDRSYISLLERGLRTPTITVAFQLADALSLDPLRLLAETAARIG